MMLPDGTPFIPETCPALMGPCPDVATADFTLTAVPDMILEGMSRIEVFYSFEEPDTTSSIDYPCVSSLSTIIPVDSLLGRRVLAVINPPNRPGQPQEAIAATESPAVAALRLKALERIVQCPGVVDGQCWALGEHATRSLLEDMTGTAADS